MPEPLETIEVFATRDRGEDAVDLWLAFGPAPVQDEDGWWVSGGAAIWVERVVEAWRDRLGLADIDSERVHRVRIEVHAEAA